MPGSFTLTDSGDLLYADGFGPVLVWRGFDGTAEEAGVRPPAAAPVLSGSGDAQPFVPPPDPPPAGARSSTRELAQYLVALPNFLTAVASLDRSSLLGEAVRVENRPNTPGQQRAVDVAITNALSALGLPANFVVPAVTPPPAIPAAHANPVNGTYYAFVRFVDKYGNHSNPGPVSAALTLFNAPSITYSAVPVSDQAKVARRQILRNTAGQASVFYVDVDTTDLGATTFTSSRADTDLAAQEPQTLINSDGLSLAYEFSVPPDDRAFMAAHRGRVFAAGEVNYREGAVVTTQGSATVTGLATEWTSSCAGRVLYVDGADKSYQVVSCDPVGQTLTLDSAYQGPSAPYAAYSLRPPPAQRLLVAFSQPGAPEAWSPLNAISLPADTDEVTALIDHDSYLYIMLRRRHYRLTFGSDPLADGGLFLAGHRGCVNHRCVVVADGVAYALDEGGIHTIGQPEGNGSVSDAIQGLFRGDNDRFAVNWEARRFFHASYSRRETTVRFYVALSGSYLPRHALCLHIPTQRWWVEEYPRPVGCNAFGRLYKAGGTWADPEPQVYLGLAGRQVAAYPYGDADGVDPTAATLRGTVTAAGPCTLTDAAATFPNSLVGCPLAVVADPGLAAGQRRLVVAVSGTTLTLDQPWLCRPAAGAEYQLAGVQYEFLSGILSWADFEGQMQRRVGLLFEPQARPASLDLEVFYDQSESALAWVLRRSFAEDRGVETRPGLSKLRVDLSKANGVAEQVLSDHRDSRQEGSTQVAVRLTGHTNGGRVRVRQVEVDGAER